MNILFVNPSIGYFDRAVFNPLGLLSIASHIKRLGHNVKMIDRCVKRVNMKKLYNEFKPDIIGVSLMSSRGIKDALRVSEIAKSMGIPVAWGGAMPTMQYRECLSEECVDYVLLSEGEFTFEELVEVVEGKKEAKDVLGLCYKENGEIIRNADRPFADLADMPVADYSLIDVDKYLIEYLGCKKMMYIYSSKGCPYNCSFCTNASFHRCQHRKRPNEQVIREIKYLQDNYGLDGVYFSDEQWVIKKEDAWDFCRLIEENDIHIHFGVQCRVGFFTKEEYQRLYDVGLRWVLVGVETGSEEIQKKVHKQIDYNIVIPAFKDLMNIGITTVASFIVGYPDETVEQVKDTVNLIQKLNSSISLVYYFSPLPGSKLYDEVVASGKYKPVKTLKEMSKTVATESLAQNLSQIPSLDLKVIRCCNNWGVFTKEDAYRNERKYQFMISTIKSGLHAISQKGVILFFVDGFKAFCEFVYTFWYSHAYPKIKRKYDIRL
ncbi:MAG: B12-binding domain-containing radical SAM protein [Eubacterium sp.]|nr:B12-binding domain-containing radical SAM protein [Eubacterium sp.]